MTDQGARARFSAFLGRSAGRKTVVLELGIGPDNQLTKAPLMRFVAQAPLSTYVTVNLGRLYIPEAIRELSFGIDGYIDETLWRLCLLLGLKGK